MPSMHATNYWCAHSMKVGAKPSGRMACIGDVSNVSTIKCMLDCNNNVIEACKIASRFNH